MTVEAHLLVVDDEPSVARFLKELLESRGFVVTIMNDSEAALAFFSLHSDSIDAVITDQTMPGLTGVELSKALIAIRSDIPIILCTGYSEKADEEQARELGVRKLLNKPVNHDLLLSEISRLLA